MYNIIAKFTVKKDEEEFRKVLVAEKNGEYLYFTKTGYIATGRVYSRYILYLPHSYTITDLNSFIVFMISENK